MNCAFCSKKEPGTLAGCCRKVKYCDQKCADKHYETHKQKCAIGNHFDEIPPELKLKIMLEQADPEDPIATLKQLSLQGEVSVAFARVLRAINVTELLRIFPANGWGRRPYLWKKVARFVTKTLRWSDRNVGRFMEALVDRMHRPDSHNYQDALDDALSAAAATGHVETVSMLIEKLKSFLADKDPMWKTTFRHAVRSALKEAVTHGQVNVVRRLLETTFEGQSVFRNDDLQYEAENWTSDPLMKDILTKR